jgi:quinol monooxygenase YgiN
MFLHAFSIQRASLGAWPIFCEAMSEIVALGPYCDGKKPTLIVFSIEIVVADQVRTALLRTLGSILEPTRVAPGCLSARLFSDLDKRKGLLLVEEWETRDQFERNLDTAKLNAIVGAIELSSEAPVVRVDTVEREEGVDTLALHRSVVAGEIR